MESRLGLWGDLPVFVGHPLSVCRVSPLSLQGCHRLVCGVSLLGLRGVPAWFAGCPCSVCGVSPLSLRGVPPWFAVLMLWEPSPFSPAPLIPVPWCHHATVRVPPREGVTPRRVSLSSAWRCSVLHIRPRCCPSCRTPGDTGPRREGDSPRVRASSVPSVAVAVALCCSEAAASHPVLIPP